MAVKMRRNFRSFINNAPFRESHGHSAAPRDLGSGIALFNTPKDIRSRGCNGTVKLVSSEASRSLRASCRTVVAPAVGVSFDWEHDGTPELPDVDDAPLTFARRDRG